MLNCGHYGFCYFSLMIIIPFVKAGNYLVCAWIANSVSGWQSTLSSDILSLFALLMGLPLCFCYSVCDTPLVSEALFIYLHFSFCSSEWIISIDNFNIINSFFYQFKSCYWGPEVKFSFVIILLFLFSSFLWFLSLDIHNLVRHHSHTLIL